MGNISSTLSSSDVQFHRDECREYLRRSSAESTELLKKYTFDSYIWMTGYLLERVNMCALDPLQSTISDYSSEKEEQIRVLQSLLINAPRIKSDLRLYQFFGIGNRSMQVNIIDTKTPLSLGCKTTLEVGTSYIEPKFSSTTYDNEVIPYLTYFADTNCCYYELIIPQGFPVLVLPEEYSFYPYQNEVLLPFGLVSKITQKGTRSLDVYDKSQLRHRKVDKIYDIQINDNATLKTRMFKFTEVRIQSEPISRSAVSFFEEQLYKHYFIYKSRDHDELHAARSMISSLVLLKMYENVSGKGEKLTYKTLYATLFHDAGRKGRDGEDLWEKDSADIAAKELSFLNSSVIIDIQNAITLSGNNLLQAVVKGADSMDIARVTDYHLEKNPFYKYLQQKNQLTDEVKILLQKLEFEQRLLIAVTSVIKAADVSRIDQLEVETCDMPVQTLSDKEQQQAWALEEKLDEDIQEVRANLKKFEPFLQSKIKATVKDTRILVRDVTRHAIDRGFFSEKRGNRIFTDLLAVIYSLSNTIPIYKQYLSYFIFQLPTPRNINQA